MKLLTCIECLDIRAIGYLDPTACRCGQSVATYLEDRLNVIYAGPCRILGVRNMDLWTARRDAPPEKPYTEDHAWWVINPDWEDSHIRKVENVTTDSLRP